MYKRQVSDFMNKKFSGRTLVVGLDWPFLGGSNEIWLAVIYSVPITLLFSMFLPGNEILPFAGIINLALAVPAFLVTGGNLIRMIILCTVFAPVFLWVGTCLLYTSHGGCGGIIPPGAFSGQKGPHRHE